MELRFLGHSTFLLSHAGHRVLIDPFIAGNPQCPVTLADALGWNVSAVLISHAHGDHIGTLDALLVVAALMVPAALTAGAARPTAAR